MVLAAVSLFFKYSVSKDGIKQEEMASSLNIDKGTTARAIKKLEEEGYIYRQKDKEDNRAQLVF